MAVDAVTVAFRTGMCVTEVANRVAPLVQHDPDQSWSIIVPGLASIEAMQKFCDQTVSTYSSYDLWFYIQFSFNSYQLTIFCLL